VLVAAIDPGLADTAAFCEHYEISMADGANCVIVRLTGMEYGGITSVGLPDDWPILVDESVARHERLIVGSGIRGSKLLVTGAFLAALPGAEVLPLAQRA
jgi:prolyl-tRNA editing enzyme YbaK/EbsC (Cys-tRNA(Pro) deacylase)